MYAVAMGSMPVPKSTKGIVEITVMITFTHTNIYRVHTFAHYHT